MNTHISDYRIVADSAANVTELSGVSFRCAPMKIITDEKEYIDNSELNTAAMVEELRGYCGPSSTSCPNPDEWLNAFGNRKYVFAVAITSALSGSYNAALTAKGIYEAEYPDRKVFLVDSLSAGPEEALIVEKLEALIESGMEFEDICREITAFQKRSGLYFMLESLKNMANSGRLNHALAKITGLLGIRIVGRASDHGTLEPTDKCRNLARSLDTIVRRLQEQGFRSGKVQIAHCFNEEGAQALKEKLLAHFPSASVFIQKTRGICSFYAEKGGLMVGYALNEMTL